MQPHRGDLFEMLYPPHRAQKTALPLRTRAAFPMRTIFTPQTTSASAPAPAAPPARFLMFRDSFGNARMPIWPRLRRGAVFSRAMPYDLSLMDDVQPDTLIVELVERNLCWLCTRPPLLPAPVREQTFDGATDFGTLDVTHSSAPWDDLVLYRRFPHSHAGRGCAGPCAGGRRVLGGVPDGRWLPAPDLAVRVADGLYRLRRRGHLLSGCSLRCKSLSAAKEDAYEKNS